jgi:formylglycine-generating enzyme
MGCCDPDAASCMFQCNIGTWAEENDQTPEHLATVSSFYLDTFEVTVGRFRQFVASYDGTPPAQGAGAHPLIPGTG